MGRVRLIAALRDMYKYLVALFLLSTVDAQAHPMPNSVVNLSILASKITGEAKMPLIELKSAVGPLPPDSINSAFLIGYFQRHIVALSHQQTWRTQIKRIEVITDHDALVGDYQELLVYFELTPPDVASLRDFDFHYDAIIHQVVTHKILVFVQDDWQNGIQQQSSPQPVGVIQLDIPTEKIFPLPIKLEDGNWWKGAIGMFRFGMKHIQEGLDHILFLLTLLLVAPLAIVEGKWSRYQGLGYTLKRFLTISLAFTLGHSITLLIGSFNLVQFQSRYIEVLIAISIFISAVNCIRPIFFRKEVIIAAGFGLIHGLAFSMSLSHLELSVGSKLISILGFNLGIEAMQLIIMACFFPVLLISQWRSYSAIRVALAAATLVISLAWVAERISAHENYITHYINRIL